MYDMSITQFISKVSVYHHQKLNRQRQAKITNYHGEVNSSEEEDTKKKKKRLPESLFYNLVNRDAVSVDKQRVTKFIHDFDK